MCSSLNQIQLRHKVADSSSARISKDIFYIYRNMVSRKKSAAKDSAIDWEKVGRRIRELRGFDLTQAEFAEQIGVSQGYLSTVEQGGREIGAEVLLAISRKFGKSIEWVLTGQE